MKMKAKTFGINFLVASCLQLKMLIGKDLQLKSLFHMFLLSFSSWKVYKQGVLSYIFIFKKMGVWDE
jgi:hypothetical protein